MRTPVPTAHEDSQSRSQGRAGAFSSAILDLQSGCVLVDRTGLEPVTSASLQTALSKTSELQGGALPTELPALQKQCMR